MQHVKPRQSKYVLNKKLISDCDKAEIDQVRYAAKQHAIRAGREYLADDFAGFVYLDLVRQQHLNYNLHWLWATFLRGELGNLKHKKGRARATANARHQDPEHAIVEDPTPRADTSDPIVEICSAFEGQRRAILMLRLKWEFTHDEIGELYGCTGQNIQRIVAECQWDIERKGLLKRTG